LPNKLIHQLSLHYFTKVWLCTKLQNSTHSGLEFFLHNLKISRHRHIKKPPQIIIHVRLVGMFTTFHCTKLRMYKVKLFFCCLFKRKIIILTCNRPPCSHVLFFNKAYVIEIVHHLKIYRRTKCHILTLTVASFAFISKSEHQFFVMVEVTGLNIIVLRSHSMVWHLFWISWKSTN
jgi:hypothetical protein